MMRNKIFSVILFTIIISCAFIISGKIDSILQFIDGWRYNVKTYKCMLPDGLERTSFLYWKKDSGELLKSITVFRKNHRITQKNFSFYQDGSYTIIDGKRYLKQEKDYAKSVAPGRPNAYSAIFSQNHEIKMREADIDGDGNIDGRSYYRDGIVYMSEISNKDNGKIDLWQYYDKNGYPSSAEYDSDGDGKPDTPGAPPVPSRNIITRGAKPSLSGK